MTLRGALLVCGTTSDAGKSTIVAGLCRALARAGVSVAPFKAQNMSLNSVVTAGGHEIGRAQGLQAEAADIDAEVAMNPILLKPTGDRTSQVIVGGRPWRTLTATEYHDAKPQLLPVVLDALADLRRRFDVVIAEGAGSPAEINLLDRDIVNLRIADAGRFPAIVVGDINPGGVFASLFGTVELLPAQLRRRVRGFVINKLRGDPALLGTGPAELTRRTGVPMLGVLPWLATTGLDAEDSMALDTARQPTAPAIGDGLDVAVIRLPRISNFTDVDPLATEAGVHVRFVADRAALGDPDLIVLPGSKATVEDLAWLRHSGLAEAVAAAPATVLGICAGYQMLGRRIVDGIESTTTEVPGLGLLPLTTRFAAAKVTARRTGTAAGHAVHGYQIHHGRVRPDGGDPFVLLDGAVDGVAEGRRCGTTLHGLFEADGFRRAFLTEVAARRGKRFVSAGASFATTRQRALDSLADAIEAHLDMDAVRALINEGAPT